MARESNEGSALCFATARQRRHADYIWRHTTKQLPETSYLWSLGSNTISNDLFRCVRLARCCAPKLDGRCGTTSSSSWWLCLGGPIVTTENCAAVQMLSKLFWLCDTLSCAHSACRLRVGRVSLCMALWPSWGIWMDGYEILIRQVPMRVPINCVCVDVHIYCPESMLLARNITLLGVERCNVVETIASVYSTPTKPCECASASRPIHIRRVLAN